jgi:hypothetical protein
VVSFAAVLGLRRERTGPRSELLNGLQAFLDELQAFLDEASAREAGAEMQKTITITECELGDIVFGGGK